MLELPTAAVYLAEAEWRAGDEDAADRAADVALDAARRQGSNHVLLQALADFPAVVSRRIDAEPRGSSPWHELGRALIAQGTPVAAQIRAAVELREFGRCAIVVDGVERRPRIAKTYELLAYLAVSRDARADRAELLDALFDGRSDDSTRAYLRQAVRRLRSVLPPRTPCSPTAATVQLSDAVAVSSASPCASRRCLPRPRGCRASSGSPRRSPRWRCTTGATTCPTAARAGWTGAARAAGARHRRARRRR